MARWKKALAITGIVLAVLVVAASVAVYALSRPSTLVPYSDALSAEVREQQTQISLALRVAGVSSSMVTVHEGTARAVYLIPENSTVAPEDWQRAVLAAMAPAAENTTTLVATQVVDGALSLEWRVPTEKVLAYAAGTITAADLEDAVTKTSL